MAAHVFAAVPGMLLAPAVAIIPGRSCVSAARCIMKYFKLLVTLSAAMTVIACDDGGTRLVSEGVETIDFFDMEVDDTETIPFEPALGFALPDRGPLTLNSSVIGSTTNGAEYRFDCPAGDVLVGVEGFSSGDRVNQVGGLCATVDNAGNWTTQPQIQGQTAGFSSGNPFSLTCETGKAVTGITGVTNNDAVSYLQLHCHDLVNETTTNGVEENTGSAGQFRTSFANRLCGAGGVATGIHGRANNDLRAFGVVCNESPATAGRWTSPFAWPVQAVHAIMTPQGDIMSYGFRNGSGNIFDYDVWNPLLGSATASHNTFASSEGVFSFCNASIVMPSDGNILLPGGTKLNSDNAGVVDVPVYNTETGGLSRAPDMANPRWYPTAVSLPNGEILVAGGRDVAGVPINTPEVYSPETDQWRSLFGANTLGLDWVYPRLWVADDGRVFGVSGNNMYYINTAGNGGVQRVGQFSNDYNVDSESTSVMYRPGKILQAGGRTNGGVNASLLDITSGTPQFRPTNPLRVSRTAWANSLLLADGKVLVTGGSRLVNDAPTAALSAEIWDPDTEEWTVVSGLQWPRLYHSNSVLLKDATVLVSGGGNPGPVTNYNAEIFSPPYLFDAQGDLAARPEISWAPAQGALGQTITLNTSDTISRVTMIKTSSVTHSFNNEQRFIELPVTGATDAGIQVQLPTSEATPGYYMIFVFNPQGTPSEAQIINFGGEPGAEPPAAPEPTPEPVDTDVNNLLANGGFEQGRASWLDCAAAGLSTTTGNASSGQSALAQQSGACLFQEVAVQAGETYSVTCEAAAQNTAYSSVSFNMLDPAFVELDNTTAVVDGNSYTEYSLSLTAPSNATSAAVTLYSEGPTRYDSCIVTTSSSGSNPTTPVDQIPTAPVDPPTPLVPQPGTNLLSNGEFTENKSGWFDCGSASSTEVVSATDATIAGVTGNVLQVRNAGCIFQEVPVTPGTQYRMQCNAQSEGSQFSSITFQMSDANFTSLESDVSVIGPGSLTSYISTITAPANARNSVVTIYSEDITRIDACSIVEI